MLSTRCARNVVGEKPMDTHLRALRHEWRAAKHLGVSVASTIATAAAEPAGRPTHASIRAALACATVPPTTPADESRGKPPKRRA